MAKGNGVWAVRRAGGYELDGGGLLVRSEWLEVIGTRCTGWRWGGGGVRTGLSQVNDTGWRYQLYLR
jgi:hypothetical protein